MKRLVPACLLVAFAAAPAHADWLARLEKHAALAKAAARGDLAAAARLAGVSVRDLRAPRDLRLARRALPPPTLPRPVRRAPSPPTRLGSAALEAPPVAPTSYQVTSEFGPRGGRPHEGIDLAAAPGTRVVAMGEGRVREAGWRKGWGYTVLVAHPNGLTTRYAHLRRPPRVRVGQPVHPGTRLGEVGSTGRASGPHLHLEVRASGVAKNPRRYWRF
jgi:murein DD-endopeptidase MepM/ murein hydrolase activator NlpD